MASCGMPEEHRLKLVLQAAESSFREELVAETYCCAGRPSYEPEALFRMLLLAFFADWTDRQCGRHVSHSVAFRRFAGLRMGDVVPHHMILCRFCERPRVEKLGKIFHGLIEQLDNAKLLKGAVQILDGMAAEADVDKAKSNSDGGSAAGPVGGSANAHARFGRKKRGQGIHLVWA
ncbi:MAG: transposase, partial [Armatimonadetes bacterium]|nr:transposase [Armatimonadota bacterium]